jgi:hypothetical protein
MPILGIIASSKLGVVPGDFESIATTTVGSGGAANIELTSIPSTYTHLQLRCFLQADRATFGMGEFEMTVNGAGGTNYSRHGIVGYGSGGTGYWGNADAAYIYADRGLGTNTGGTYAALVIDILDYKDTNKYKTVRGIQGVDFNGSVGGYTGAVNLFSGAYKSTSAITSVKFVSVYGNFTQYSQVALYGIKVV